jgi:hypothetical protein
MYSLAYETGEQGGNCLPKNPFLCCMLIHLSPMHAGMHMYLDFGFVSTNILLWIHLPLRHSGKHPHLPRKLNVHPPTSFGSYYYQKQMPPFRTAEISSVG